MTAAIRGWVCLQSRPCFPAAAEALPLLPTPSSLPPPSQALTPLLTEVGKKVGDIISKPGGNGRGAGSCTCCARPALALAIWPDHVPHVAGFLAVLSATACPHPLPCSQQCCRLRATM